VRADGVERSVVFADVPADPSDDVHARIDAAYHAKYDRYGPTIVGTVVGPAVTGTTLRLEAAADGSTRW
jgi:hypothetical protein